MAHPLIPAFIETVRSYCGTRWRHQGRLPGIGLDCGGVHVCAAQAVGLPVHDHPGGYPRLPDGFTIEAILSQDLVKLDPMPAPDDLQPGDLLLFDYGMGPGHLAVWVGDSRMVDSWMTAKKVCERGLDMNMAKRMCAVYRWPDLEVESN